MEITILQSSTFVFYRYVADCFSVLNDKKSVIKFENISKLYLSKSIVTDKKLLEVK